MKTYLRLFFIIIIALLAIPSCQNEDIDTDTFKIERERVIPSIDSVSITGSFSFAGTVKGMRVNIGEKESLIDANTYEMKLEGTDFSVGIGSLKPSTKYFYRYTIDFGTNDALLTETKSFTTLDAVAEVPTVKAIDFIPMEDSTTYRIKCEVVEDGGSEVTERGVCWNTYGDPTEFDNILKDAVGGLGRYFIRMEQLTLGKTYYVRAYAKNTAGIGLSEEVLEIKAEAPAGMPVEIVLSCSPEEGGTVSGGGTFEVGTPCTVTATANTGYSFVNWTENGNQVASEASYTFTVTAERNLVANFSAEDYIIAVEIDPEEGGTATGAGGYNYGDECTLKATPKTGYEFLKWTKSNNTVSTNAEYTFTVTGSASYVAHFKTKSYTVSVAADPENGGTVDGGGTYNYGLSCTVHATPADCFAFAGWTDEGDVVSTEADFTFTVTSDRSLVANFTAITQQYTITVSANPTNGGSAYVGSTPGTTHGSFNSGQYCSIHASANPGYRFTNWTENGSVVSASASYTFTVTGNRSLVANFEVQPQQYTITVSANPTNGGTLTGGGTYDQGVICTVTATAKPGFSFVNWMEGSQVVSTDASYSFTVTGNRTLVAHFEALPQQYTITVSANPSNGGAVSGGGTYIYGQSCTVHATAYGSYSFGNWTENGNSVSSYADYSFTVLGDRSLVANFSASGPSGWAEMVSIMVLLGDGNSPAGTTVSFLNHNSQEQQNHPMAPITIDETGYYMWDSFRRGNYQVTVAKTGYETIVDEVAIWEDYFDMSYMLSPSSGAPQGAINGLFSVSATEQVYFSQGNLQYQASSNTWRFAENQYDYIGSANSNISSSYSGWIDLFGWGTSGYNHGAVCYQPWSVNANNNNYYAYGSPNYNLSDQTRQADWGYNPISNGDNTSSTWHTLTSYEWNYVLNSRNTSSGIRFAKARVNNVNGMILLPDNWSNSYYTLSNTNSHSASFSSNIINTTVWVSSLEAHGAVFLPSAGDRSGSTVSNVDSWGYYWSASYYDSNNACGMGFFNTDIYSQALSPRYYGFSVRLVRPAQ